MFASTQILVVLLLWTQVAPSQGGLLPIPGNINLPLLGKLNLGNLGKIAVSLKGMAEALHQSDFILVVIKGLDILRNFIGIVKIPNIEHLDSLLEMVHGFLEGTHATLTSVKENIQIIKKEELDKGNDWIFDEKPEDKGILSQGLKLLTSVTSAISSNN